MAGARIEISGAEEARQALAVAVARTERPRDLYDALGAMLALSTDKRFEDEKDPEGNPWPKSVRAMTDGGKTLTDTTALRGSNTWEATDKGVAVGTNMIYAAIHQFGGVIKAKNGKGLSFEIGGERIVVQSVTMPKRAFLGVSAEDEKELLALAGEWLLTPLGGPDSAADQTGGVNA
jgi:phage virion morphogenesis protein